MEAIRTGVDELITADEAPDYLNKAVKNISKIKNTSESDDTTCQSCQIVVEKVLNYRRSGASRDSMTTYFIKLCMTFMGWRSIPCQGMVNIERVRHRCYPQYTNTN